VPAQQISRRLLLGATTAALLSGCNDEPTAAPSPPATTDADPGATAGDPDPTAGDPDPTAGGNGTEVSADDRLVANAVAGALGLAGAYAALAARHPDTRRTTAPLRAHLREHLAALGEEGRPTRKEPAARSRSRAVQAVLTAEQAASAARTEDAVAAASGDLARALASIAACHAQHAIVLEEL
jgi:hypothetical protein